MNRRFSALAWAYVAYLLLVILFGDWVRITGSGAGCGAHWPLCDGEVVPRAPSIERMIEYTHRVTSGLCGLISIALVAWAGRALGTASRGFRAAAATLFLVLVEGAIGAALVKLELVANDTSTLRAVVVGLHLGNTLLLMACASATAWWTGAGHAARWGRPPLATGWFALGLGGIAITAMAGAVTALGDTLFPVGSLAARDAGHLLIVQLRVVHPLIAVVVSMGLAGFGGLLLERTGSAEGRRWIRWTGWLLLAQLGWGVLNIALKAPGWAQLVHLLLAQLLWMAAVLATIAARDDR